MIKHFKKMSDWIDILKIDESLKCEKYKRDIFEYNKRKYNICDFTKIHNNPWFGNDQNYPQFITGVERTPSSNEEPLYIEINDSKTQLRVYVESKE